MVVPFPLYVGGGESPDSTPLRTPNYMYFPLLCGSTTILVASTVVFSALGGSFPVAQFTIYNNGANPMWVTEAQQTTPAVSAAVGQGILLNPGDLMIETNWPCPVGTVAIAVGGSTSAVWTVAQ